MIAMELSGVHLRRHVTITWKGSRSERQYKVQGTLREIVHPHLGKTVKIGLDEKVVYYGTYPAWPLQSIPYYADIVIN